jgi:hypothetical protein
MKQKFMTAIVFIAVALTSCSNESSKKQEDPGVLSKDTENYYNQVKEFTYEGCEYIKVGFGKCVWGSHKGNCKNPIHKIN